VVFLRFQSSNCLLNCLAKIVSILLLSARFRGFDTKGLNKEVLSSKIRGLDLSKGVYKKSLTELTAIQMLMNKLNWKAVVPILKIFGKLAFFGTAIGFVITAIIRVINYLNTLKIVTEALGWVAEKAGNIIEFTIGVINQIIDEIAGGFIFIGSLLGGIFGTLFTALENLWIWIKQKFGFSQEQNFTPITNPFKQAMDEWDKFMRRNVTPIETGQKSSFDLGAYTKFIEERDKLSKTIRELGIEISDIIKSKLGYGGDIVGFTEGINKAQDIQYKWQEKQLEDNKKIIKLQEEIKENTNQQNELFKSFLRLVSLPVGT